MSDKAIIICLFLLSALLLAIKEQRRRAYKTKWEREFMDLETIVKGPRDPEKFKAILKGFNKLWLQNGINSEKLSILKGQFVNKYWREYQEHYTRGARR